MDEFGDRNDEAPQDGAPRSEGAEDRGGPGGEPRVPREGGPAQQFGGGDLADRRRRRGRRGRGGQRFTGGPRPGPQRGPMPPREDEESSQARELAAYERRQAQQQRRPGIFRGPGWVAGAPRPPMPGGFRPQGRPMGGPRGPRRAGGAQYTEQIRRATAGPRAQAAPSHEAGEPIAGPHAVIEAIRAGRQVKRLYVSNERGTRTGPVNDLIAEAQQHRIFVRFVDPREIERLSPVESHQGVLAIVEGKPGVELDELLLHLDTLTEPALVLVIDSLQDPQNFGVILRSAEGTGVDGVVIPRHRSVGITPAVAKTSAGASEHLMIADVANLRQAIDALKEKGVWVVGTDETGDLLYDEVDYRGATAIVIGGEAEGIRRLVLEGCDQVVRIPMQGQVASLNAAAAGTVVLYEALRQRMRNAAPSATRTPPPRPAPVMPSDEDMNDEDVATAAGHPDEQDLGEEEVEMMSIPSDERDESAAPVASDVEPDDETAVTDEAVPETADATPKPKKRTTRKTAAPRKTTRKKNAE